MVWFAPGISVKEVCAGFTSVYAASVLVVKPIPDTLHDSPPLLVTVTVFCTAVPTVTLPKLYEGGATERVQGFTVPLPVMGSLAILGEMPTTPVPVVGSSGT